MIGSEFGLDASLLVYQVEEARRQREREDPARGLRLVRPGRLSRQGGWLPSRLGHSLVVLGQRLEGRNLPQASLSLTNLVHEGGNEPCTQS